MASHRLVVAGSLCDEGGLSGEKRHPLRVGSANHLATPMIPRINRNGRITPVQWVSVLVASIVVSAIGVGILVFLIGTSNMTLAVVFALIAGAVFGFMNYGAARRRKAGNNPAQMEPPG